MAEFDDGPPEGNDPSLPPRGDGNDGDGKKANSKASAATSKTPRIGMNHEGLITKSEAGSLGSVVMDVQQSTFQAAKETEAVKETEAGQQVSLPIQVTSLDQPGEPHDRPVLGETDASQPQPLVGLSAGAYYLMQFPNQMVLGPLLHHQYQTLDEKMDKLLIKQAEDDEEILLLKADKIRLRREVEKLSTELVGALNNLQSLQKESDAEKHANKNLQARAKIISEEKERLKQKVNDKDCKIEELEARVSQLSNRLEDVQAVNERLVQDAKKRENELAEFMLRHGKELEKTKEEYQRLEQEVNNKDCKIEELDAWVSQLNKRLNDVQEVNERQKQETLAEKSAREELQERVRQLEEELDVAKQYLPKNPEKYPLNPFTGYAIVVSNAVFNVQRGEYKKSMQDVANQLVADDAQKAVLDDAIRLAKALSDYGFEVKPMRNATDDDLLAALVECDMRWEQDKLVLIFIITHGNSAGFELANSKDFSQREVADVLVQRNANGKPTILCMATCRHQVEGDLDLLDDAQSHVFLVNARRLGQRHFAEDKWFVDGLVKIFEQETERNFLTEIADMRLLQRRLDFDDRLGKILILPAFPARTWPPEEKEKTYNLVKSVFKYDSKPAQTTTAGTA